MRNTSIDVLKALASQVIVVHHLLLYTPMSDALQAQWPTLLGVLADEGRYVVQVFLVIGGFLAAQSLMRMAEMNTSGPLLTLVWKRFLRLAKPFWVAMACAVFFIWLAGRIAFDTSVHLLPSAEQLLAHFTLTHDLWGVPALSAGVWYVAIDFQLFVITLGVVFVVRQAARLNKNQLGWNLQPTTLMAALMSVLTVLALLWWNRNPEHEEWGWYFLGSYGLGFLAQWAARTERSCSFSVALMILLSLSLAIEWRERLLLTGLVAMALAHPKPVQALFNWLAVRPVRWLGDISYSVFLIHYSVAVLASAVVIELNINGLVANLAAFALTWLLSIAAGWLLYHGVEAKG